MSTNGLPPPTPTSAATLANGKRTSRQMNTSLDTRWCSGCRQPIRDQFLLYSRDEARRRDEKYWHQRCLKCDHCGDQLDGGGGTGPRTYWTRGGRNFCLRDYQQLVYRQGGPWCAACKRFISSTEYVVKITQTLIYHSYCLACSVCQRKLSTGDKFVLAKDASGAIICSLHGPPAVPMAGPSKGAKAKQKLKPPTAAQ